MDEDLRRAEREAASDPAKGAALAALWVRRGDSLLPAVIWVLRETENPAVMWGDEGLLHVIAKRAGLRAQGQAWRTSDAVLRNLSRQPGELVSRLTTTGSGRRVRVFRLPECVT